MYWVFMILILACVLFASSVSANVHRTYNAMRGVATKSRMTGRDTAVTLLRENGVTDIQVGRVRGVLSDHYHPTKKQVNLSEGVYGGDSVASVAVSAHEIGHVMQKKEGYLPYKLRAILVPITNIGSKLAIPLVLIGILLEVFLFGATQGGGNPLGYYLAIAGVVLYGTSTLFALATLPVELDASRRAKKMLLETGILTEEEMPFAEKMLSAAAMTYLASLLTSLVYFLRFAWWVLRIFGRSRD